MLSDLNATSFQMGSVLAFASFIQAISSGIWGRVSDAVGRKSLVVSTYFMSTVSWLMISFCTSIYQIMAARGLICVLGGPMWLVKTVVLDDTRENDEKVKKLVVISIVGAASLVIGPTMGAILRSLELLSRRGIFLLSASLALIAVVFTIVFLRETLPEEKRRPIKNFEDFFSSNEALQNEEEQQQADHHMVGAGEHYVEYDEAQRSNAASSRRISNASSQRIDEVFKNKGNLESFLPSNAVGESYVNPPLSSPLLGSNLNNNRDQNSDHHHHHHHHHSTHNINSQGMMIGSLQGLSLATNRFNFESANTINIDSTSSRHVDENSYQPLPVIEPNENANFVYDRHLPSSMHLSAQHPNSDNSHDVLMTEPSPIQGGINPRGALWTFSGKAFASCAFAIVQIAWPLIVKNHFFFTDALMGIWLAAGSMAGVAAQGFIFPALVSRYGAQLATAAGGVIFALGMFFAAGSTYEGIKQTSIDGGHFCDPDSIGRRESAWLVSDCLSHAVLVLHAIGIGLMAMGISMVLPGAALVISRFCDRRHQGWGQGVLAMSHSAPMVIAPLLTGWFYDAFEGCREEFFVIAGVLGLLSGGCFYQASKEQEIDFEELLSVGGASDTYIVNQNVNNPAAVEISNNLLKSQTGISEKVQVELK